MSASALVPSPSSAGASAATPATDARVQLHRHAQESVLTFLTLAGLATAMAVSRDWQAAVGSMRSFGHHQYATARELLPLMSSRMRQHVTDIFITDAMSLALLAQLHERMPHLLRLSCETLTIASGVLDVLWPPRLQQLLLYNVRIVAAEANMLLESIGTLTQLQKLHVKLAYHAALSFASLASLPLLRVLTVSWNDGILPLLSEAQVDQLRALNDLEEFDVSMNAASFLRLLRPPHALRWQVMPFPRWVIGDDVCALLPGLTCLTDIRLDDSACTSFDFLPRCRNLATLSVGLSHVHLAAAAATQSLMASLMHCQRITSLSLYAAHMPITAEQLETCLAALLALSSLCIWEACLPSLAFLSVPSLAHTLQQLTLAYFTKPKPNPSELHHLRGLRSLRRLTLDDALSGRMDAAMRAAFTPPSKLLPLLEQFQCN